MIYSKKSWREGKVVKWVPAGAKSTHRSGVLEFDPMLYLNTKTGVYDKKVGRALPPASLSPLADAHNCTDRKRYPD